MRMSNLTLCCAFALFLTVNFLKAQKLPTVIPPSPDAAAFARYGEIPVDYSTGVPRIEVPIYTIKSRKLELPINISYHASGIKVNDVATTTGLGWVLNAGGIVTRTVIDKPDDQVAKATYKTKAQKESVAVFVNAGTLLTVGETLEDDYALMDKQSDRFYYQLNGRSGVFRYNFLNDSIIKIPYAPVVIKKIMSGGTFSRITGFLVTDENGIRYSFTSTDRCFSQTPGTNSFATAWYLTDIISADKTDTIRFTYKNITNSYSHFIHTQSLSWRIVPSHPQCNFPGGNRSWGGSGDMYGCTPLIDQIISSTAVITCSYIGDRQDGPAYRLSSMSIADRMSGVIKTNVAFNHSYFGAVADHNQRLRLDNVSINNQGVAPQNYSFVYNPEPLPAYPDHTTPLLMFNEDYWGYYNRANNGSLIPHQFIRPDEPGLYRGDRDPRPGADACMLQQINYPTSGKTVFEFERHQIGNAYDYFPSSMDYGGFRVKNIKNYSKDNKLESQKHYTYDGFAYYEPIRKNLFAFDEDGLQPVISGPVDDFCKSEPVFYNAIISSSPFHSFKPVMYDKVSEYIGTTDNNIGKTVYEYTIPVVNPVLEGHDIEFEAPCFVHPNHYDKGDPSPRLNVKTIFKNVNGIYKPVQSDSNTYTAYRSANVFNTGVHVIKRMQYYSSWGLPLQGNVYLYDLVSMNPAFLLSPYVNFYFLYFKYFDTKGYEEVFLLTKTSTAEYDVNGIPTLRNSTSYVYNPDHLQPIEQTTTTSKGETLRTTFKYPSDFPSATPYNLMLQRNIRTPVIVQKRYKGTQFLDSMRTNYTTWLGQNIIEPQTVETRKGTGPSEIRLRFQGYNNYGSVTAVSKEGDVKYGYLYDYKQSRPVAQVLNASVENGDVAYTSFEADGKGNWTYNINGLASTTPLVTGKKCYNIVNTITKSGLTTTKTYIVSFWQYGGTVTVSGGTITALPATGAVNGWTLVMKRITGASSLTISGTGSIDELRLYPEGAQMTTYTYDPLVGQTSATDPNNVVTYFEYDPGNRLKAIIDYKGNVLKTFNYHYKQ